jgi:phosphoribosylformylglycinamidine cyclo-ligase
MLKEGTRARIDKNSFEILPIFKMIQKLGDVSERDMFNTYNMGVGLMFVVPKDQADKAVAVIQAAGEKATVVGEIVAGEKGVDIC